MIRLAFGPSSPIIEEIRIAARRHAGGRARISVAWARDEGVCWLLDALDGWITHIEVIVGINEGGTTVEGLLRLLQAVSSVTVFFKHPRQTFHPKFYWFDDDPSLQQRATLIVGSSNLTRGGLITNFEASLVAELGLDGEITWDERQVLETAVSGWSELLSSPYAHQLTEPGIHWLFEHGYIVSERTIQNRSRHGARPGGRAALPSSPPPRVTTPRWGNVIAPFPIGPEAQYEPSIEDGDPEGITPLPDRFFVTTLTAPHIARLHGVADGTFEPDLGETARDRYSSFWGWPDNYQSVTRRQTRLEWEATARLISSVTPPDGVPVTAMLWYRESRPGHAAEHRLGLQPIPNVRAAVPNNFDNRSLLVVQRAPERAPEDFIIRFVTPTDLDYADFASYLSESRMHTRFGYGP